MKKQWLALACLAMVAPGVLQACSGPDAPQADAPSEETVADESTAEGTTDGGTLQLRANGEDFVRQGFVTKDGWQVDFEHLYVNLAEMTAYQTDPPYDPDSGSELQAKEQVSLQETKTVDLAEGDASAEPILVSEVTAPEGQYNALSWKMMPAADGPAAGSTIMMVGTAQKEGETVDFVLRLDPEFAYTCGEFVGDERKGIVAAGDTSEVEATFHFDHIFGDGEAPADDPINTGALGFDPLAALATDGQLEVDMATLKEQLSPEDYSTLEETVAGLGHVGEGHCSEMLGNHAHS